MLEYSIVFVHGLNGHPKETWTSKNGVFWPVDLLPPFLEGLRVRILTYGYNADVTSFFNGTSKDRIHHHAETLAADLTANRNVSYTESRHICQINLGHLLTNSHHPAAKCPRTSAYLRLSLPRRDHCKALHRLLPQCGGREA